MGCPNTIAFVAFAVFQKYRKCGYELEFTTQDVPIKDAQISCRDKPKTQSTVSKKKKYIYRYIGGRKRTRILKPHSLYKVKQTTHMHGGTTLLSRATSPFPAEKKRSHADFIFYRHLDLIVSPPRCCFSNGKGGGREDEETHALEHTRGSVQLS